MEIVKRIVPVPVRRQVTGWRRKLRFERQLRRAVPVNVYQMGKVGSSSICRSLEASYPGAVVHTHGFSPTTNNPKARRLYRWAIVEEAPLKVISLTREPIGRNVSAFFQNYERDTGVAYDEASFSIDQLKDTFLANYNHDIPLRWFDDHILANFGIDVFATPFPANGVATYSRKRVELLVMRVEVPDSEKVEAIRKFLGLDAFELHNRNIGAEKEYSTTYAEFRRNVRFSREYIDRMCHSKYFRHFYSEQFIETTRRRWSADSEMVAG